MRSLSPSVRALLLFLSLSLISLSGCASKRAVYQPEQPGDGQAQAGAPSDERREGAPGEAAASRESITERQLSGVKEGEGVETGKEVRSGISDIYFDFDSYEVREDVKPSLRELASVLSRNKKLKAIIEGHCDDRGTTEYNLGLGDKRALAVKRYLLSLGIPSSKIETISYGEEKPLCTEQTEDCWAKNRRAHIVLIEEGK